LLFRAGLVGYVAALFWLIYAASGMRVATFRDPNALDFSWKRIVGPAVVAGLFFGVLTASLMASSPSSPSLYTLMAAGAAFAVLLSLGCLASGAAMMWMSKRGLAARLKRREANGPRSERGAAGD
jgi:hypothetical protein